MTEPSLDELRQGLVLLAQDDTAAFVADALLEQLLAAEFLAQQRAQRRRAGVWSLQEEQADVTAEDGHGVRQWASGA